MWLLVDEAVAAIVLVYIYTIDTIMIYSLVESCTV